MGRNHRINSIAIIAAVTYLIMIITNALANTLPINGVNTGEVSDSYLNLFAPAPVTFAIWGLIYLLLAFYTLYQFGLFHGNESVNSELINNIGILFTISSLANAIWIFSWHYFMIPLSVLLMVIILVCLILINQMINQENLSTRQKFFIRLPFSVYFGWITVATIANITTFLVGIGWNGFGISKVTWTVIILFVGMLIGFITMLRLNNIAYGLVLIWAYIGIYIKHTSAAGFGGQYQSVTTAVLICLAFFVIGEAYLLKQFKDQR